MWLVKWLECYPNENRNRSCPHCHRGCLRAISGPLRTPAQKQFLVLPLIGVAVRTTWSVWQVAMPKFCWHFGGGITPLGYNHRLYHMTDFLSKPNLFLCCWGEVINTLIFDITHILPACMGHNIGNHEKYLMKRYFLSCEICTYVYYGCMFFFSPQKYILSALSPQRACSAVVFLLSACCQWGKNAELHDIKCVIVRMIIN